MEHCYPRTCVTVDVLSERRCRVSIWVIERYDEHLPKWPAGDANADMRAVLPHQLHKPLVVGLDFGHCPVVVLILSVPRQDALPGRNLLFDADDAVRLAIFAARVIRRFTGLHEGVRPILSSKTHATILDKRARSVEPPQNVDVVQHLALHFICKL